jgi:hypothetical protein
MQGLAGKTLEGVAVDLGRAEPQCTPTSSGVGPKTAIKVQEALFELLGFYS